MCRGENGASEANKDVSNDGTLARPVNIKNGSHEETAEHSNGSGIGKDGCRFIEIEIGVID